MPTYDYKGHQFSSDHELSADEWKQTLAYFDSLPTKKVEQPSQEPTSALSAFTKSAAESIVPSATGLVGAGKGARLGFSVPGPLPVKVGGAIIGGLGGGIAGGMLGEEAQQFVGKYIPEEFKQELGMDKEQRALETKEHPYASFAGQLAPNLAAFRPGAVAPIVNEAGKTILGSGAQRAVMGAAGAGIEAGSELVTDGKVDPVKLAMAGAFQAGAPVSTRLGKRLFGDVTPSGAPDEKIKIDTGNELADKAIYIERVLPSVESKIEELKLKLDKTSDERVAAALSKKIADEEITLAGMKEDLRLIRESESAGDVTTPNKPVETPPKTDVEVPPSDLNQPVDTSVPPNAPFEPGRTTQEVHASFLEQLDKMEEHAWGTNTLDKVIANKERKLAEAADPDHPSAPSETTIRNIETEVEALRAIRDGKMTPAEVAEHLRGGNYDAIKHVSETVSAVTPELQAAIKTNRLADGVRAIADSPNTPPMLRNLANRLLSNENFGKFTNIFYDNQIKYGMQTSHKTGDISVRSGADVNPVSYMHESVHTSTSGAMLLFGKGRNLVSPAVAKAMDSILGIYDSLKGKNYNAFVKALDGDKQLADLLLTNERELLAYALTDTKLGAALNSMMDGNKSIFRRLLDNVSEAFGFTKKQEKTMLDSLYESAGVLIDEYKGPVDKIGVHGFDPIFNYRDKDGDIGLGARDKFIPIAKRFLSPWTFKNFWRNNPIIDRVADIADNARRTKDMVLSLALHGTTTVEQYKGMSRFQRLDRATSPEGYLFNAQKVTNKEYGEIIPILLLGERDGLDAKTLIETHGAGLSQEQRNLITSIYNTGDLVLHYSNEMTVPRGLGETKQRLGYFLKSNNGDNIVTASRNGVVTRMEFYLTKAEQQRAAKRLSDEGYNVELSDRKPDVDYEGILQTLNDILETGNKTGIPLNDLIKAKTETIEMNTVGLGGHRQHRGFLRGFAGDISALTLEENGKAFRHAFESNLKSYVNLIEKRQIAYDSAAFFNGEGAELVAKQPNATSVARYYLDNQLGTLKSPAEGKISGTVNSLLNEMFAKVFPEVHMERDAIPYAYNLLTRGAYNMVLTSAPVTWVTQALGFLQSGRMLFKENSNPMYAAAAIGKAMSQVFFKKYSDDAMQGMHYIAQNTEVFHKHMTSEVADYQWDSDKKTIVSKMYRWFSGEVFTSAGDAFSRVVAWNMANELLLRSNPDMPPKARWEKAGDMASESMIKMGRENLPGMYKELGFIGSAISPLKSYVHGQFSNLAVDIKDVAMRRDAASVMALAMNAMGMMIVGGGLALPFMADYEYLRQSMVKNGMIAYDALPNWTKFMEEQDPIISRGLISGLTGVDMGASMRYQSIMKPFAETLGPESWTDALLPVSTATKFASGAGTLVKNAFGGVSDWQVDKAIEKVVPRGYVRGALDAMRHQGDDAVTVGSRGEDFVKRGPAEITAHILGSKSNQEAKAAAIVSENEARTKWASGQKQQAVDLFLSKGRNDTNQGIDIAVDLIAKGEWTPKEFTTAIKSQLDKQSRDVIQRMITNKRGEVKSAAQKRALTNIIDMMDEE